jgi:hypothetical protein
MEQLGSGERRDGEWCWVKCTEQILARRRERKIDM